MSKSWADMDEQERAAEREMEELKKRMKQLEMQREQGLPAEIAGAGTGKPAGKPSAPGKPGAVAVPRLSAAAPAFTPGGAAPPAAAAAAPAAESKEPDAPDLPQTEGLDPADKTAKVELSGSAGSVIYKSIKSFEELGLSADLLKGVVAHGFTSPSKIQADALPIIMSNDGKGAKPNMIAQAHHGSGKTATYSLGMLSAVDPTKRYPQALCVCPVRELANQVHTVVSSLAKYTEIKSFCAVAGAERGRKLTEQVLVGTPGSLLAKLKAKEFDPKKICIFVLDEADVMVDKQGQGADMLKIRKTLPKNVQVLLFSATYADRVRAFAAKTAPNAVRLTVKRDTLALANVKQFQVVTTSEKAKYELLSDLYGLLNLGQSIIFCTTKRSSKNLCQALRAEGFKVSLLNGDLDAKQRDLVMDDFRKGTTTVLISTDVLSRGIDVPAVNMCVNYELPTDKMQRPNPETYIHRIGRTGRFGRAGVAISMVHDAKSKASIDTIADYYKNPVEQLPQDADEIAAIVKKALSL